MLSFYFFTSLWVLLVIAVMVLWEESILVVGWVSIVIGYEMILKCIHNNDNREVLSFAKRCNPGRGEGVGGNYSKPRGTGEFLKNLRGFSGILCYKKCRFCWDFALKIFFLPPSGCEYMFVLQYVSCIYAEKL